MSFTVKLCVNGSPKNSLTKNLNNVIEMQGDLKQNTSLIKPTFIFNTESMFDSNYIVVEEFKRSYFIENITAIRGKLWEVECSVDVLSSFRDAILNNTVIVDRQENNWNLYLNDDSFKCYQNPHIIQKEFPLGFNTQINSYVLLVAGKANLPEES